MTEPVRLSQAPPERASLDYSALRELGMEWIRELAGASWTDHNVHDPGITILEAFSYAMTELGFRIQLDMGDLLRSGEVHAPTGLLPAHRVLPCAPVTLEDLRLLLFDHPLVEDALLTRRGEGEVGFYENPGGDPPFFHESELAAGDEGTRVELGGLYELLVAFAIDEDAGAVQDLNSNTYDLEVTGGFGTRTLDAALPPWDEELAEPFRQGAVVLTATMVDPGGGVWRPLGEPLSYFGRLRVGYDLGGPDTVDLWIVLRIPDDIDQSAVSEVLQAARDATQLTSAGSLIDRYVTRVRAANDAVERVQHYIAGWRNLCEDPVGLSAARVQEIGVGAHVEVAGGTDLERLLAEIFLAIDRELSPPLVFRSLGEYRAAGKSVEDIFDGPLLRHGFLVDDALEAAASAVYASDILRLIMRLRTAGGGDLVAQENPAGREIVAVTQLRLSNFVNNRPVTTDAKDCLRLVETDRYRPRLSVAKSRIVFTRDGLEVDYDAERVVELFRDGKRRALAEQSLPDPSPMLPEPAGEALPVESYTPVQHDLPANYGVGPAGLPATAGIERRAQALQAQGYLHLFDQFLADATAQLARVNCFFSADPEETATYFTRPLLDLAGAEKLIAREPSVPWPVFAADPANSHVLALRRAVEGTDRFLDRRNRMFDHLLARLGEQTVGLAQELHRRARKEVIDSAPPPAALPDALAERRRQVNARLTRAKAEFLADAPELAAFRLQAFGHLLHRRPDLVVITADPPGHRWRIDLDGTAVLRSPAAADAFASEAEAASAAEEALTLAPQTAFYDVVAVPGGRRYRLKAGSGATDRVVGESGQTFATIAAAQSARLATAEALAALRLSASATPLERRIAHHIAVRVRTRRRLVTPIGDFFELQDAAGGDSTVEGWLLRELAGPAGGSLLEGAGPFTGASDSEAVAAAMQSIAGAIRLGIDEWQYLIVESAPGVFEAELAGVARLPGSFATREAAADAVATTAGHLYAHFGTEGFHLVEHLLLRPRRDGDPFLSFPVGEDDRERDPYSHRLSLVFPSGRSRDFSDPADPPERLEATPHRFRDPEFRRHVERVVRAACPAHILPSIFWVDRDLAAAPAAGSYENFEDRYFAWLGATLIPGVAPASVRAARAGLVGALNAIAQG